MTGYRIYYIALGSVPYHGSEDVSANKTQHTLSNLHEGFVYIITMVTKSWYLSNTATGPIRATLGKIYIEVECHLSMHMYDAVFCIFFFSYGEKCKSDDYQCTVGERDALQDSYLSHYTIYYSAFSPPFGKDVDKFTKVISSANTAEIANIRELRTGVKHQVTTASLKVDGELYEGVKPVPANLCLVRQVCF